MNENNILQEVQNICVGLLRVAPSKVVPHARLIEDLDLDSLFAAELGLALEKAFKIEVPEEVIATFKTVEDVASYVGNELKRTAA